MFSCKLSEREEVEKSLGEKVGKKKDQCGKTKTMLTLDAGCGYLPFQAKREGIGIDLQRGRCDVVGDIQRLPFRSETFDKVYARNVLEHLDKPIEGLNELKRVMRKGGKISITIPIHHSPYVDELIKFVFNFPFRIPKTLKRLMHWRRHSKTLGSSHKNRVTINEISKFFQPIRYGRIHLNYSLIRALQKAGIVKEGVRAWIPAHNCYIFAAKVEGFAVKNESWNNDPWVG